MVNADTAIAPAYKKHRTFNTKAPHLRHACRWRWSTPTPPSPWPSSTTPRCWVRLCCHSPRAPSTARRIACCLRPACSAARCWVRGCPSGHARRPLCSARTCTGVARLTRPLPRPAPRSLHNRRHGDGHCAARRGWWRRRLAARPAGPPRPGPGHVPRRAGDAVSRLTELQLAARPLRACGAAAARAHCSCDLFFSGDLGLETVESHPCLPSFTTASTWAACPHLSLSPHPPPPLDRFAVDARYYHGLHLGRGSALNVLTGGRARDLALHHDPGERSRSAAELVHPPSRVAVGCCCADGRAGGPRAGRSATARASA